MAIPASEFKVPEGVTPRLLLGESWITLDVVARSESPNPFFAFVVGGGMANGIFVFHASTTSLAISMQSSTPLKVLLSKTGKPNRRCVSVCACVRVLVVGVRVILASARAS